MSFTYSTKMPSMAFTYLIVPVQPLYEASQVVLVVKNPPANAGNARDVDLIPRLGRFPGEGNDNPFQFSCRENPKDRGAWRVDFTNILKVHII